MHMDGAKEEYMMTMKQLKLPKSRVKNVACFLYYQNYFSIDFPLKKMLEDLEVVQVKKL